LDRKEITIALLSALIIGALFPFHSVRGNSSVDLHALRTVLDPLTKRIVERWNMR